MNCSEIGSVMVVPRIKLRDQESIEQKKMAWRVFGWTASLMVSAYFWIMIGAAVSHLLR